MTNLIALKLGSEYGVLKDQLLRFDPRFNIDVSQESNGTLIEISLNPGYVEGFFSEQVSYITGLVGKNGVGKSTLLRFIKELFIQERTDLKDREKDIIFYTEGAIIKIYLNEDQKGHVKVVMKPSRFQYEFVYYRGYPKLFDRLKNFTTVFYSNNLDLEQKEVESKNYFNISTSYLLENVGRINAKQLRNRRITNNHSRFKFFELRRQIEFLNEVDIIRSHLGIPFKRVDNLEIEIIEVASKDYEKIFRTVRMELHRLEANNVEDELENLNFNLHYRKAREFLETFYKDLRRFENYMFQVKEDYKRDPQYYIQIILIENLIYQLIRVIISDKVIIQHLTVDKEFRYELLNKLFTLVESQRYNINADLIDELVGYSFSVVESYFEYKRKSKESSMLYFSNLLHLRQELDSLMQFKNFIFKFTSQALVKRSSMFFDTKDVRINNLLKEYFAENLNFKFIKFSWPKLSAGEESLIAFFSRLNSISKEVASENLLLLIDEGDLYFHPEWQRKYIHYLLKYFSNVFLGFNNIQVILTTHSPFLLSDLPSDNIILLDRKDEGSEVKIVDTTELSLETFGGNINTLYAKAFFLGESTSEFALQKIKKDIIEPLKSNLFNREEVIRLISKIGEPVIKNALLNRLNSELDGTNRTR